jgi:Fe-S cluster assembly protein SufD
MTRSSPAPARAPFAGVWASRPAPRGPLWLARLRREARTAFEAMGLPAAGNEDWRQTNTQPLASIPFVSPKAARIQAGTHEADPIGAAAPVRIVLVDGRLDPSQLVPPGLPEGVVVEGLARRLASAPETVEPYLGRVAPTAGHPFVALNGALFEDGVFVSIPAECAVEPAIHVLHVVTSQPRPTAVFPRVVISAGTRSRATVVETFVSASGEPALTAAVTEIVVGEGARIDHVKVQAESEEAWHVATVAGRVDRDGRLASHNVSWGAKLARNDIGAVLDGEGASCHLYGLYLADGTSHVDNHTWLDHAKPHCPSWEMYKGILAGSAKAVFNGRIVVREGAQKTDAKQSNKNLLLSDGAVVYTRPQLEIYANDVRCTHGATIGRLDEAALFYLRSRGLGAVQARDLLVHAFADDVLGKIPDEPVRAAIGRALYARLAPDLEG